MANDIVTTNRNGTTESWEVRALDNEFGIQVEKSGRITLTGYRAGIDIKTVGSLEDLRGMIGQAEAYIAKREQAADAALGTTDAR